MQMRAVVQQPLVLPDPVADPVGFADAVRDQLQKAHRDVTDLRMQLDEERNLQDKAAARAREQLESEVQRLRSESRISTVLGYSWDFIGWLLLITGMTLGAFATGVIYFTT
jgi:hypothetical protein